MIRITLTQIFTAFLLTGCAVNSNLIDGSSTAVPNSPSTLTIERLFSSPSLSGEKPRGVKFSPDGQRVTFLKGRADDLSRFDLWAFDVSTGQQSLLVDSRLLEPEDVNLSEEEKALRERKRIAGSKGIVSYDWGTSNTILVPLGGDLHLVTLNGDDVSVRQLTQTDAFEYDAKVSSTGKFVSFIRDGALYAIDLSTGVESRLSPLPDPDNAISYGVAEFVAQEEMSRYTGYWWSPDDTYVAFTRVNESTVDIIPRFDISAEDVTVIEQRYPRAGRPNAIVDMFIRDIATNEIKAVDIHETNWGAKTDQYLARAQWLTPHTLSLQTMGRDQQALRYSVVDMNAAPLTSVTADWERQDNWVNLSHDMIRTKGGSYLNTGEDNPASPGFRHLYLQSADGTKEWLTDGNWAILDVEGLDSQAQNIFFTGFKSTPLETHLYSVNVDTRAITQITKPGKTWSTKMAPDGQSFVASSSSPTQPPQTGLYKADGSLIAWIEENALNEHHPYAPLLDNHTVPTYGTIKAENGMDLYYSIQTPPNFDAAKQYPAIVQVYGGPHVQTVTRDWERTTDQFYTHQGYVVFRLDNRGSSNRGKAFEDVIYRHTGNHEVKDQLAGVAWLKSQSFVAADKVAIQGWSYGGYMTLMTVLQAPKGTFAAAAAGAPVTDWSLYDTFYTERYMSTPQDNPDGYEASSVFPYVDNLATPLLLMHGMADDNVTFDNTTRLMAALQERGKHFELMTYPGQRHGIRGEALQIHLMWTRMKFLDRHLKTETPTR